ncbi:hypothetical protein J8F10_24150 [Gemmata sp. G18]|uniref:Phage head morphogenesis domain-containing protein n=1 Tax=Gemmata palustris TaxID=2822762 RepID=A0ABS5BXG1_9BACT|nr:phage minor head protein [Gemmata palustris]MBP3958353.1 hypothetical protein [Gemmata palustris]
MNRRTQLNAWLAAMAVFERRALGDVGRARNAMILYAASTYQRLGSVPSFVKEAHRKRLEAVITQHYKRVIPHFGNMALSQIKSRPVPLQTKRRPFADLAAEWIKREALRKATMIAATDFDDVRNAIQDGFDEGEGTDAIARRIRKVTALTPHRAATVARTETHAAATFGSVESVREASQELGVTMKKEWLATRDDRTRPDHAAADGQQVGLDEKFTVGGVMMDRPGDPSAPIESIANCRCAMTFEEV